MSKRIEGNAYIMLLFTASCAALVQFGVYIMRRTDP